MMALRAAWHKEAARHSCAGLSLSEAHRHVVPRRPEGGCISHQLTASAWVRLSIGWPPGPRTMVSSGRARAQMAMPQAPSTPTANSTGARYCTKNRSSTMNWVADSS